MKPHKIKYSDFSRKAKKQILRSFKKTISGYWSKVKIIELTRCKDGNYSDYNNYYVSFYQLA